MLFSENYGFEANDIDDWFDPIMLIDTRLFIDPFQIFRNSHEDFKNSYKKITDFFAELYLKAAQTPPNNSSPVFRHLLRTAEFKEVQELCLGYSGHSTAGSGSGRSLSTAIINAIYESIHAGISNLEHFEEISLFNEGIGCDRISDITAGILKEEFITYTQKICEKKNIQMQSFNQRIFDNETNRWAYKKYMLPENPYYENRAVLLTPKRFLGFLPSINPDDFFDFCYDTHNEEVRDEFGIEVKKGILKKQIIDIANKRKDWVEEYVKYTEEIKPDSYDLKIDIRSVYTYAPIASEFTKNNPLSLAAGDKGTFKEQIEKLVKQFTHFVENCGGYQLLWTDRRKHRSEKYAQLTFLAMVVNYCSSNNIDISKEVNIGRGPVDFKFSIGYQDRALVEMKLANNSSFYRNITNQLPQYLASEQIDFGYYIIVCFKDDDFAKATNIENIISPIIKELKKDIRIEIVDASLDKPSASKL